MESANRRRRRRHLKENGMTTSLRAGGLRDSCSCRAAAHIEDTIESVERFVCKLRQFLMRRRDDKAEFLGKLFKTGTALSDTNTHSLSLYYFGLGCLFRSNRFQYWFTK